MIFSSYQFLLIFLPIALLGYGVASKIGPTWAAAWLGLCSIAFYAVWNVFFVLLLLFSIAFNYTVGTAILKAEEDDRKSSILLALGIVVDLSILFFFKYFGPLFNFFAHMGLLHSQTDLAIILPLGISFFTFTQIGYLIDCRQGLGKSMSPVHYVLFVTFFPHLVAGPILHIREVGPQILSAVTYRLRSSNLSIGFSYFILGLTKKVMLADPLAQLADASFAAPGHLQLFGAWAAVLTYSVQLYFDFSGYSDMAVGLAYMFGIKFPLNFNSPYKARSIIDFWQRWHMTLTRYLTLLLFNPVTLWMTRRRAAAGKPIKGKKLSPEAFASVVVLPTVYTMFLAGIWHGAGLQFIVFGLLHAGYLSINHAWRGYGPKAPAQPRPAFQRVPIIVGQVALTYGCVIVAQVFFRAGSVNDALSLLSAMAGGHGVDPTYASPHSLARLGGLGRKLSDLGWLTQTKSITGTPKHLSGLLLRYVIIFALPNTQQIMAKFTPYLAKVEAPKWKLLMWEPQIGWAAVLAVALVLDLLSMNYSPPFLYFQF